VYNPNQPSFSSLLLLAFSAVFPFFLDLLIPVPRTLETAGLTPYQDTKDQTSNELEHDEGSDFVQSWMEKVKQSDVLPVSQRCCRRLAGGTSGARDGPKCHRSSYLAGGTNSSDLSQSHPWLANGTIWLAIFRCRKQVSLRVFGDVKNGIERRTREVSLLNLEIYSRSGFVIEKLMSSGTSVTSNFYLPTIHHDSPSYHRPTSGQSFHTSESSDQPRQRRISATYFAME